MTDILIAVLSSAAVFSFITFLIQRRDSKKNDLAVIQAKLAKIERDQCRTQLLILITNFPNNKVEILKVAEHYFLELEGNWYMSELFRGYCESHDILLPSWFLSRKE